LNKIKSSPPPIDTDHIALIQAFGAQITPIEPLGAAVKGIELSTVQALPSDVRRALEFEIASRGFLVFKNEHALTPDDFLRASCWWGGRELQSTHGVHPATPDQNRHIFRLSNDQRHGIPGVGPQWHNDGSFLAGTFSHSGYHIVRPAERGGGTWFAHQASAYDALPDALKASWRRLTSVNSNSGVLHPLVHQHPITGSQCIWLHLGMTGAVIEKQPGSDQFRLLPAGDLRELCRQYNEVLNAGFDNGYAIAFEYEENDCVFIDNLAVAHRAAPEAHMPAGEQGLRIMHRSTVKAVHPFAPDFSLPQYVDIQGPNPFGGGVWQAGGIGFRWDDAIAMQN